jgi:hypothetical protein
MDNHQRVNGQAGVWSFECLKHQDRRFAASTCQYDDCENWPITECCTSCHRRPHELDWTLCYSIYFWGRDSFTGPQRRYVRVSQRLAEVYNGFRCVSSSCITNAMCQRMDGDDQRRECRPVQVLLSYPYDRKSSEVNGGETSGKNIILSCLMHRVRYNVGIQSSGWLKRQTSSL